MNYLSLHKHDPYQRDPPFSSFSSILHSLDAVIHKIQGNEWNILSNQLHQLLISAQILRAAVLTLLQYSHDVR